MAAPAYTEDLTDIDLAETTTGYAAYGGGGAGLGAGPDFAMQGTNCVDKQITAAEKGIVFDNGAGITIPAGEHVFQWLFNATPGVADSLVNRGAVVCIGDDTSNFVKYHVAGNDTYGAGGRVGVCYPIDPSIRTANTGSIPYRTLVGTPTINQVFGVGLSTTASVKSANLGCDAVRYGTGAYLTAGELLSAGDASDNPITFDGFATQNDLSTNRWGILTKVGNSYELQGVFAIGQNNSKVATLARFKDSDVNIIIPDTVHSTINFSRIEVDHASTRAEFNNVSITALGTNNKGQFLVNANNPTVIIDGGAWTGFGITTLRSNTSVTNKTWRGAKLVTLNGASLDGCTFDKCVDSASVLTSNLNLITNGIFNSDGSNHAVELDSIGGGSMIWSATTSGYDAGSAGSPITPTNTGNEDIYVNVASGTLTINVADGASTPSVRSAGATINVVAGSRTVTITVEDESTGLVVQGAAVTLPVDATGPYPYQVAVTITQAAGTATVAHTAHGFSVGQKVLIDGADQNNYNRIKTILSVPNANSYTYAVDSGTVSPATGTITATAIIIDGVTDVLGQISDTRVYTSNQDFTGTVQKGTRAPIYKARPISGTIDSTADFSLGVLLTRD